MEKYDTGCMWLCHYQEIIQSFLFLTILKKLEPINALPKDALAISAFVNIPTWIAPLTSFVLPCRGIKKKEYIVWVQTCIYNIKHAQQQFIIAVMDLALGSPPLI